MSLNALSTYFHNGDNQLLVHHDNTENVNTANIVHMAIPYLHFNINGNDNDDSSSSSSMGSVTNTSNSHSMSHSISLRNQTL